jgi:tetratricopeptide (TPR) repeat protein
MTQYEHNATLVTAPSHFIGRKEFIQDLHETLHNKHLAIITGSRGIGKTAVVQEYARLFAHEYQQTLWIDAMLFSSLYSDSLELAQRLKLPLEKEQNFSNLVAAIQQWANTQPQTLIVLDNVTFPHGTRQTEETRSTSSHIVLIAREIVTAETENTATSTSSWLPSALGDATDLPTHPAPILHLPALTTREGALLVLQQSKLLSITASWEQATDEQHQLALQLAHNLHGSPLAIKLAGGYLQATGNGLQTFDHHIQPTHSDEEIVHTISKAILAYLTRMHPVAHTTLQLCALLAPTRIPLALLQQTTLQQILFPQQQEQPATMLAKTVQTLLTYGLLAIQGAAQTLEISSFLQTTIRQLIPLERQHQLQEQLLHACLHFALSAEQTLSTSINLAGHIWFLANQDEEYVYTSKEAGDALAWAASLLSELDLTNRAEPLLRRTLIIWEGIGEDMHPNIAGAQLHLALMDAKLGLYAQAETYAQQAIANTSQTLGVDHPNVLYCMTTLGQIYQRQQKYLEARLCYEKALSIGERVNLQQHPHYLAARQLLETIPE